MSFLPVTAPFHSQLLAYATPLVCADVTDIQIQPSALRLPVNQTRTGECINTLNVTNLVPHLIRMVTTKPVS